MTAMAARPPSPSLPVLLLVLLAGPAAGQGEPPAAPPPPEPRTEVVVPPAPPAGETAEPGSVPEVPAPAAGLALVDRVVAVIDEDPILASDVDRIVALRLVERAPGEGDGAYRRRVLGQMIEDRLRFHEIDRFGFQQVPVDEIERQVEQIRRRFADPAELDRQLAALGMTVESLRQLVTRQLLVLNYVEERLGPRVFVSPEHIQEYYDQVLAPEAARHGQAAPPLDEVREQIRAVLREQRLNQEIERWTEELRREADIADFSDREERPLPPVVHRIGGDAPPG